MDISEYNGRVKSDRNNGIVNDTREIQGQSPYLINAGLNYASSNGKIESSINYNVQGRTLQIVGTTYVPDVYTEPFNSINFNANYKLGENNKFKIGLRIKNILNEKVENYYLSFGHKALFSSLNPGREFKLSLSINF